MGKSCIKSLLLLAVCVVVAACGKEADVKTLKMAHSLDQTHPVHKAIVFMSDRLESISGGKMKIDIYPGGQLGDERELMELLQIGSLAMTKVSSSPMEGFVPAMKVFNIPYVFRDNEHFWRVLNSAEGEKLLLSGDSVNLRGLGYFDAGSRSFYTTDTPVHSPEDLKGLKIRVQQSQTALRMVQALGGSGTPISWGELYTALSQGVVDGAENNPPSFYTSKHYEVSKFYTLNEHTYVPDIVLISSYIWNHLNAQQQQWLQQAMDEAVVYERKLWAESTAEALAAVEAAGVTVIRPDKKPFMERVEPMHESYKGTELYDLIQTFKAM
ncbi:TRAP transporter substrate-binding protein [Gilvimarinus japonicus]|jgi:tripartite ATP-independent transporter DctP family solute receptor|uniref:TRAP transporter substrate-binding protein n=1 Tax=Gilvimarinus japonicus TaxID=1796469 RepID=A0ABV7HQR9_9GAMM